MRWERMAPTFGAVGGLVFILINAGRLSGTTSLVIRCLGTAAFAFVIWYTLLRRRPDQPPAEPISPRTMRIYWISVAAEVAAILIGATVIASVLGLPHLTICWVILVLGVHFLPFGPAFELPIFTHMGWTLAGIGLVGGALTLTVSEQAAPWTAITAGAVMLYFAALGVRMQDRRAVSEAATLSE